MRKHDETDLEYMTRYRDELIAKQSELRMIILSLERERDNAVLRGANLTVALTELIITVGRLSGFQSDEELSSAINKATNMLVKHGEVKK